MNDKGDKAGRVAGDQGSRRPQREVDARLRKMRAIARRCARMLRTGGPPVDHGDLLYDDRGLPR